MTVNGGGKENGGINRFDHSPNLINVRRTLFVFLFVVDVFTVSIFIVNVFTVTLVIVDRFHFLIVHFLVVVVKVRVLPVQLGCHDIVCLVDHHLVKE